MLDVVTQVACGWMHWSVQVKRASSTEMVWNHARLQSRTTTTCVTSCGRPAVGWYTATLAAPATTWTMLVWARNFVVAKLPGSNQGGCIQGCGQGGQSHPQSHLRKI